MTSTTKTLEISNDFGEFAVKIRTTFRVVEEGSSSSELSVPVFHILEIVHVNAIHSNVHKLTKVLYPFLEIRITCPDTKDLHLPMRHETAIVQLHYEYAHNGSSHMSAITPSPITALQQLSKLTRATLYSAILFCSQLYPWLEQINISGIHPTLDSYTITQYGQTWLERHFMAHLTSDHLQIAYNEMRKNLHTHITPFEYFAAFLCVHKMHKSIPAIYKSSDTYMDFFRQMYQTHGSPKAYVHISPWIDSFLTFAGIKPFTEHTWYIKISNIKRKGLETKIIKRDPSSGSISSLASQPKTK
jgi:hypothetical protein